jgi:hypothetical protein
MRFSQDQKEQRLTELRVVAKNRGGRLLSEVYENNRQQKLILEGNT